MKKKWIALLIGLLLMTLVAVASAETVGGVAWWSNVGGTFGSKDISWSLDRSTGEMTLTGKGSMGNYSLWGVLYRPWDNTIAGGKGDFVKEIKKVTVGEGITDIAGGAFSGCPNLISVTLPSTLEKIGDDAFRACNSLTSIVVPDKVKEIGENAFFECTSLVKVQLSKKLQRIGKLAFSNCSMLSSINIPSTVESIEEGAFKDTPKLMLNMDVYGFIGKSAFLRSGITGVTIHNCTGMTEGAFSACKNLQSAKLDCDITVIPDGAFSYDTALRSINIPNSVQTIGYLAFTKCTSLSSITLPNKLGTLGDEVFSYSGLKSIVVPDTVDLFGKNVFTGCSNLMTATLPKGLALIPDETFKDCTSLLKVNIPSGVTLIGYSAFGYCSSLLEANLPEGLVSIDRGAFQHCDALRKVTLPDSLTSLGVGSFGCCGSLQSISIPDDILSLPEDCFYQCEALISVKLPKDITTISRRAFYETKSLTSITFPESLVTIGEYAFYSSGLTKVDVPVSLVSVDSCAFLGCPIKTVNYAGTEKDWNDMMIADGNDPLINAYKNPAASDPDPEPEPDNKVEAYVTRCYSIILGRKPDAGGLQTWYNELTSGRKTASEIIDRFVNSPEYLNKNYNYGDSVDILYRAMLGRNADAGGKANWVKKLENGQTLAHVINGFCFSKEFRDLCDSYGIKAGFVNIPNTDTTAEGKIKAFVQRCYRIILDREADPSGMQTWYEQLSSGKKEAAEIIDRFVNSPEFSGKNYNSSDSVEILYKAMLGRGSDAAGKANWVGKLDAGQPFAVVINGFCVSKEFTGICDSYGIKPGSVTITPLSGMAEEEALSMLAYKAKEPITKKSESNPSRVEIINPSDTIDMNIGTAVQAVYINEEKAKEFISRCYQCILGREASDAELADWIGQMTNGTKTPDQIARGFLFSNEFKGRNVGNEDLVKILYKVYMNRDADPEGLATWTEKLDNDTSLKDLLDVFAKTREYKNNVIRMGK